MIQEKINNNFSFQTKYSFETRYNESCRVLSKYPGRIPIICEKNVKNTDIGNLDKNKYLVPFDLQCGQFIYTIRKRLNLPAEKGIFILINGITPSVTDTMGTIYHKHKNLDNFLYVSYSSENVFG